MTSVLDALRLCICNVTSPQVHANQADDVFLRVGDKSKLQTFEERLQLNYDKGERYFEDKAVPDATIASGTALSSK